MDKKKTYHELIEDGIFIGGAGDVPEVIEKESPDVVVDLRSEALENDQQYHRIHVPIEDNAEEQDEFVKKAIDQVVQSNKEGNKVFLHCAGGSNRTGTVAAGTLLALGKASSIEEAEEKVKMVRPVVSIKPELKETLKRLFPNLEK